MDKNFKNWHVSILLLMIQRKGGCCVRQIKYQKQEERSMRKQGFLKRATMLVLAGAMMIGGTLTAHAATGQWKQNATGWVVGV